MSYSKMRVEQDIFRTPRIAPPGHVYGFGQNGNVFLYLSNLEQQAKRSAGTPTIVNIESLANEL
jgi:hypothetical protein